MCAWVTHGVRPSCRYSPHPPHTLGQPPSHFHLHSSAFPVLGFSSGSLFPVSAFLPTTQCQLDSSTGLMYLLALFHCCVAVHPMTTPQFLCSVTSCIPRLALANKPVVNLFSNKREKAVGQIPKIHSGTLGGGYRGLGDLFFATFYVSIMQNKSFLKGGGSWV